MAVTETSFKVRFPALKSTSTELVEACIASAELRVKENVWGDLVDEGVLYLTAHLITIDPAGIRARKTTDRTETVYFTEYKRLQKVVASGFRVSGSTSGIYL